ncbi:MAG: hypothetical protein M5U22_09530 [Thermoleophilia bacterium]|nr:hypothetical protein [Thermoleophilia bacterium]
MATHTINPTREDPIPKVLELTNGVGAEKAIVTIDNPTPETIGVAFDSTGKGGRTVLTGVANIKYDHIKVSPFVLAMFKKELVGTVYGDSTVRSDPQPPHRRGDAEARPPFLENWSIGLPAAGLPGFASGDSQSLLGFHPVSPKRFVVW